jgi:hypothetical protein
MKLFSELAKAARMVVELFGFLKITTVDCCEVGTKIKLTIEGEPADNLVGKWVEDEGGKHSYEFDASQLRDLHQNFNVCNMRWIIE